jgi:hypothetical protein
MVRQYAQLTFNTGSDNRIHIPGIDHTLGGNNIEL